jgi:hypothetical protein
MSPLPVGTASCIYLPRFRTRETASFTVDPRAAVIVLYSPRLSPAAAVADKSSSLAGRKRGQGVSEGSGLHVLCQVQLINRSLHAKFCEVKAEGVVVRRARQRLGCQRCQLMLIAAI